MGSNESGGRAVEERGGGGGGVAGAAVKVKRQCPQTAKSEKEREPKRGIEPTRPILSA